jgi:hypothetical protein
MPSYAKLGENDDAVGKGLLDEMLCGLGDGTLLEKFVDNMLFVAELLANARGNGKREVRRNYILNRQAKVFVCWYSQLRELLNGRNGKSMASKMRICAMPGGGFRGDWYLAVAKGSVSLDLGVRAVEILTRKSQEYDRFSRGVGLPVRSAFRERGDCNFFAWPHAEPATGTKGEDLFKIHRASYSRASIPKYTQFRRMLAIMVDEVLLAFRERQRPHANLRASVRDILKRLPHQVRLLAPQDG